VRTAALCAETPYSARQCHSGITVIRGIFKYAFEIKLIDVPVRYGKAFDRPSATLKRKTRRATELENGKRLFTASSTL
jgi:hypothetical protein